MYQKVKEKRLKHTETEIELSFQQDLKKFVFSKGTQKFWADDILLKEEKEAANISKLNIREHLDLHGSPPSSVMLH